MLIMQVMVVTIWVMDFLISRARLSLFIAFQVIGTPVSYELRATIRYSNPINQYGYAQLFILKDDGTWVLIWTGNDPSGVDVFWTSNSDAYYRSDGSMYFKLVGQSSVDNHLLVPS